jgi:hypothetical protein
VNRGFGGRARRPCPYGYVQTPDDVADQVLAAVESGRAVVETTRFVRIASAAARHAPGAMRWISALMAARGGEP